MDPAVWVALIVGCSSLVGPLFLNALNGRTLAKAKTEENAQRLREALRTEARQDKLDAAAADVARLVEAARIQAQIAASLLLERDERQEKEATLAAEKAEETAATLVEAQAESIRRTDEVARLAEETAVSVGGKLDEIHHLVNSSMTAAMLGELGAVTRELAMMREVVALHEAAGRKPSREARDAIAVTSQKVVELRDAVADRERQTAAAEAAKHQ